MDGIAPLFDNEYITGAIDMIVSSPLFEKLGPSGLIGLFFGTEVIMFVLSVVIWGGILLLRYFRKGTYELKQTHRNTEFEIHRYNPEKMGHMYNIDKQPTMFTIMFKSFIFPVFIIFVIMVVGSYGVNFFVR